jgi:bacillithiol system protein YtxJ
MEWKTLSGSEQIDQIIQESFLKPVAIFKHSTRCSISHMAKGRLERELAPDGIDFYYLDLLTYRPISSAIAERFQVHHESPQIIVFKNGEVVYDESHMAIQMQEIASLV